MIPKSIVLNGDKQAKCIQDDLWHLAVRIVSKRSSLKITWKDDSCLKINILHKRRSEVEGWPQGWQRERGREEWDKGRLKGTIKPWKEGFSWCSTDPMKLGQTHLSLSLVSQSFQRRSTHGGVHVSHVHTHARPLAHTHTGKHSWTQSWGHNARTVWELSNGELRLTWKPHESTTGKHRRNLFDIGNTLLYPLCTHKIH